MLEAINDFGGVLSTDELDQWKSTVSNIPWDSGSGGHFKYYRNIKSSPSAEEYVLNPVTLNKWRVITQLRCGCLLLEIELGRYRTLKPPLSERTCQLCDSEVGDKPHFLLKCQLLNTPGETLIDAKIAKYKHFTSLTDEEKLNSSSKYSVCASNPTISNAVYHMYRK